jgi:hypothetical protein
LQNGEIIKRIILKQNEVAGIISGKEEFKEEKADINDMPGKIRANSCCFWHRNQVIKNSIKLI